MDKKQCSRCKQEKLLSEFQPRKSKDGRDYYCAVCRNEYWREYYAIPKNRLRQTIRNANAKRKERQTRREELRLYYRERNAVKMENPIEVEKAKARRTLQEAVKRNEIKRLPCEVCGESKKGHVHAHHDDYSKPLEVRWLCPIHHKLAHIHTMPSYVKT